MQPADCHFCRLLATGPREDVVWEFSHSVAVLGRWQCYRGYCVLIARQHATELSQLAPDIRAAYLEEMCLLAQAIEQAVQPRKLNYELLGNQVGHLHWHLFPRHADDPDPMRPVWFSLDTAEKDDTLARELQSGARHKTETIARLRQALGHLPVDVGEAP